MQARNVVDYQMNFDRGVQSVKKAHAVTEEKTYESTREESKEVFIAPK